MSDRREPSFGGEGVGGRNALGSGDGNTGVAAGGEEGAGREAAAGAPEVPCAEAPGEVPNDDKNVAGDGAFGDVPADDGAFDDMFAVFGDELVFGDGPFA